MVVVAKEAVKKRGVLWGYTGAKQGKKGKKKDEKMKKKQYNRDM